MQKSDATSVFFMYSLCLKRTFLLSYNDVISVWLSFWRFCRWLDVGADLPLVLGSLWSFFHFILLF